MKRWPFASRSRPPSPRQPSVTRMPAGKMPVGWNCTASMLPSAATPVSSAIAAPMPSQITALVVTRYTRPAPPVAIAVALAT